MENKLCCLVNPVHECIGCELRACSDHSHNFGEGSGTTIKCPYIYKREWAFDSMGHAWGLLEDISAYRIHGR
jgi:hypothetical protein